MEAAFLLLRPWEWEKVAAGRMRVVRKKHIKPANPARGFSRGWWTILLLRFETWNCPLNLQRFHRPNNFLPAKQSGKFPTLKTEKKNTPTTNANESLKSNQNTGLAKPWLSL